MFRNILLCYDGTPESRKALTRGAELAVSLRATATVLSIVPGGLSDPTLTASLAGNPCIGNTHSGFQRYLDEAVQWLLNRGVEARGILSNGDFTEQILHYSKLLHIDLIVVGHYPNVGSDFWWSPRPKRPLAELANCCVLVAIAKT